MVQFHIGKAQLKLDMRGRIASMVCLDGTELIPVDAEKQPFLQLGLNGRLISPSILKNDDKHMVFTFNNGTLVKLICTEKEDYSVFQVEEVNGEADALVFGPILTVLAESIGDIVGVVQGEKWALGIQALNIKTLGGFPIEFSSCVSPYVSQVVLSELSVAALSYYGSAGYAARVGKNDCSVLQLYCENRSRVRERNVMGHPSITVQPMVRNADATLEGAAYALFCCTKDKALQTIGKIEVREGLPHPVKNGEWLKTSRKAMEAYLIAEFNPQNFEKLLAYTKKAGFSYLYHPEPFADWGHFRLREDCFPKGDESLAEYC